MAEATPPTSNWLRGFVLLLGVALAGALVRLAWISDDAYITLRTVENFLAGHGLVWNVGERVQVYTHPAWMWLLCAARWCTGEHYFATIGLSLGLSGAAAFVLARSAGRAAGAIVVLLVLLASRAFGDFATSGLETPLAALLIASLAVVDGRTPVGGSRLLSITFLAALLATTRLDLIVLAAPVVLAHLLAHVRSVRFTAACGTLLLGLLPVISWTAFALFYYGSPVPITAYAKALSNGVPVAHLLDQGVSYFLFSAQHDPATMATIAAGALMGAVARATRGRMLGFGVFLYCLYVVRVGGDFMAGRFFFPPLLAATALLARWFALAKPRSLVIAALAATVLGVAAGPPPFLLSIADDLAALASAHGITDERRCYFAGSGLVSPQRDVPIFGEASASLRRSGRTARVILACETAGRVPFVNGDLFHIVDRWILDPLLMRLPVKEEGEWRIGHFARGVPDGYLESLAIGENRIRHPGLRAYFADLLLVTRAPLWRGDRLAALWRLWWGSGNDGLRAYVADEYRNPRRRQLRASDLPAPAMRPGTFWFDEPRAALVAGKGLEVSLDGPVAARTLRISLSPLSRYRLFFFLDGKQRAQVDLVDTVPKEVPRAVDDWLAFLRVAAGQTDYEIELPEQARTLDRIEVVSTGVGLLVPALGGFELLP